MALVCDTKSNPEAEQQELPKDPEAAEVPNEDLEDGEIEDDEEEAVEAPAEIAPEPPAPLQPPQLQVPQPQPLQHTPPNKFHNRRFDRGERYPRHDERKRGHLTEAEKSVMHLHKLERIEREKRERFKREQQGAVDDFAINIEKAIANVLKRKQSGDDEKEEDRGKKRKKKERDRKKMKGRNKSPKPEEYDETELLALGMKRSSPDKTASKDNTRSSSPRSDYDSYESSESSDRSRDKGPRKKRGPRGDARSRERKPEPNKEPQGTICVFSVQGKCNKGDECPFIHEGPLPMKLELCKFYLNECCAKGDKCLYMHSEFPCKFYHTGLKCQAGDTCKFAHGKPLHDGLKQILYKHIETAPKEILGDFPRLNRDSALNMINQAQKALEVKYGAPGDKRGEIRRNRPSRWQDADPSEQMMGLTGFYSERDHDMRINSNGDIDMRTLPPHVNPLASQLSPLVPNMPLMNQFMEQKDIDIRSRPGDLDIRLMDDKMNRDVDIRQLHFDSQMSTDNDDNAGDEPNLQIVMEEDNQKADEREKDDFPANLPKKQRELFLRIQAQQKENVPENQKDLSDDDRNNIDWYSDDDDDCRLTIKVDAEDARQEDAVPALPAPAAIEPVEVIEKLGDLSKIDISEEVTKLLSSISQSQQQQQQQQEKAEPPKDPRLAAQEPPKVVPTDPRRARQNSTEKKPERISIYEQGSISIEAKDVDLRNMERDLDLRPPVFGDTDLRPASGRADIDLRQLGLPFKAMQNYTPASEIDASISSHPPMPWKVYLVEIPRPDYTGLKLSAHDAQSTGDPRLRKMFRLSTEEKDSPASPKESVPKVVRQDPRRRREEKPSELSYAQQLNILQTSAFYNSLTSSQKLLLNQELTVKKEGGDSTLNGILANLGLVPGSSVASSSALTLLASVNNMNPMMGPQGPIMPPGQGPFMGPPVNPGLGPTPGMVQPGLLGAAPGVPTMPTMPPEFQLNFDPRQGGLLGNAPPGGYNEPSYNFNDDYYEGGRGGGRGGRGFRDRSQRRGRNFSGGRNSRSFRNNRSRSNRSRTPP